MVRVDVKATDGGKAKEFRKKTMIKSIAKARETIRARGREGYVLGRGRVAGGGQEMKFHDLDIDDAVVSATGTIAQVTCNEIVQGVTESQRVGRKCVISSINWRFTVALPTTATAANTSDVTRVILYLDKQCNGATATVTNILETADYQSFNNLANKNRFQILMDKIVETVAKAGSGRGSTDTLSYADDLKECSFYKKCEIPIEYDATLGAITEIKSNNLGVLTISRSGLAGMFSKMRLRFTDN